MMNSTSQQQGIHENEELSHNNKHYEQEQEDEDDQPSGCFNNLLCCFPRNNHYRYINGGAATEHTNNNSWLVDKLKNVKEVTESLAGPKFKTFIRKFGGYIKKNKRMNQNRFQYDSYSYALNFDSGDDDGYDNNLGFSRFPATPLLDERGQPPSMAAAAASGGARLGL